MKKKYLLILMIGLLALTACNSSSEPEEIRPTPTAVVEVVDTSTLPPTAEIEPTTLPDQPTPTIAPEPTLIPTATAVPTLPICNQFLDTTIQPSGTLYLRYWSGNQVWLWSETAGQVEAYTIEDSLTPPNLSPDGRYIAFTRPAGSSNTVELWVADSDGSNQRLLVTASPGDLLTRYPEAIRFDFYFYWKAENGSPLLTYYFSPVIEALGDPPPQPRMVVDVITGESWLLEAETEAYASVISPDGQQTAVLLEEAIQLLDTREGTLLFTITVDASPRFEQLLTYSPDGSSLIFFTENGIALINPADGTSQEIPLPYVPVGLGHYSALPGLYWNEDGTAFYTIVTDNQQVFDQSATFSIWYIDLTSGQGQLLHTFNGSFLSADLSPDRKLVAFWLQNVNDRRLFLADVVTGQQIEYARGELVEFLSWNPDGRHFLYWLPAERKPILGHPCQPPVTFAELGFPEIEDNVRWVDANRFLYVSAQAAEGNSNTIWTIYLNYLNGQSQAIAAGQGPYPQIEFYFEP